MTGGTVLDRVRARLLGVVDFWAERAVDTSGGYRIDHGADGVDRGGVDKHTVVQARMVWAFSAFARRFPDRPELLAAAAHGVRHLIATHDDEHGGWTATATPPTATASAATPSAATAEPGMQKLVYVQSFVVYALAEYHLASGDQRALDLARTTWDRVVAAAEDGAGGFRSRFTADWQRAADDAEATAFELLDVEMHLIESTTSLLETTGDARHAEVLSALTRRIAVGDAPSLGDDAQYGQTAELGWLLRRAAEVLGDDEVLRTAGDTSLALERALLDNGIDAGIGGVFQSGSWRSGPVDTQKEWWPQCEALTGMLDAWEHSGDPSFLAAFTDTWAFVDRSFFAPSGEMYALTERDGTVVDGDLANHRKAAYHSGRMLLECSARLERIGAR